MSEAWTAHALKTLAAGGYRAGGAREAVIDMLGSEGGCMTPEDIGRRLKEDGRHIGMASVYRAVALLEELGLLQRVALGEGALRYDLIGAEGEHHHHIVCRHCGETLTFEDPELEAAIHALSARVAFDIDSHDVTLRGSCPGCRQPDAA